MGRAEIKRFKRGAEEVMSFLKPRLDGKSRIKIIAHSDTDGIASAAILARCFYYYNVPFTVKFGRVPNDKEISKMSEDGHDLFIFLDLGSSQSDAINRYILSKHMDVIVIDHHPGTFIEGPNIAHLNPHIFGLNGATDISASGATFSVVEQLDLRFRPLIGLAIVGAIGDRQDLASGFTGVNDTLIKRGVDLGLLSESEGLNLIRRSLIPVVECIRTSTRPYIVGLSSNMATCRSMIDALGISHFNILSGLGSECERILSDAIYARVGSIATNEEFRRTLWGAIYKTNTDDLAGPKELREYAAILDACGNLKRPEIGFAIAVGDENSQADGLALLNILQEKLLQTMGWIVTNINSFKETSTFRYIYFGEVVDSALLGEALSLSIASGLLSTELPVIGLSDVANGQIKISARCTQMLTKKGVNLGHVLSKTAPEVGGFGGGHDVAAAARIPRERMDEFITKLDGACNNLNDK